MPNLQISHFQKVRKESRAGVDNKDINAVVILQAAQKGAGDGRRRASKPEPPKGNKNRLRSTDTEVPARASSEAAAGRPSRKIDLYNSRTAARSKAARVYIAYIPL